MAGKKIYFGALVEALLDVLDALAPALTEATQSQTTALTNSTTAQTNALNTNLSTMITSLGIVNDSISQNISAVNVRSSANQKVSYNNPVATQLLTTSTADYPKYKAKMLCNGTIRLTLTASRNNTGSSNQYVYVKNGLYEQAVQLNAGVNVDQSVVLDDIPVSFGDVVEIGLRGSSSSTTLTVKANTIKVSYDIVNIVTSGAAMLSAI